MSLRLAIRCSTCGITADLEPEKYGMLVANQTDADDEVPNRAYVNVDMALYAPPGWTERSEESIHCPSCTR